jgi:hypothetical protein
MGRRAGSPSLYSSAGRMPSACGEQATLVASARDGGGVMSAGRCGRRISVIAMVFALAIPAVADADVLVNAIEPATVACGKSVRPGIWYQSFSGGPHWAHMTIKNSHKVIVWRKNATATANWRYWHFRGTCGAVYVLTYRTAAGTAHFTFHIRS